MHEDALDKIADREVRGDRNRSGSVVVLDPDGGVLAEYPLAAPAGFIAAPKTVAYDGLRGEIWLTTDLLPLGDDSGTSSRHDTFVLDSAGAELRRIESPESVSTVLFHTATSLAQNRDLLEPGDPALLERRKAFAGEIHTAVALVDRVEALAAARRVGL